MPPYRRQGGAAVSAAHRLGRAGTCASQRLGKSAKRNDQGHTIKFVSRSLSLAMEQAALLSRVSLALKGMETSRD